MKKRGFKMRSGNNIPFKKMGSSPLNQIGGLGLIGEMQTASKAATDAGEDFDAQQFMKDKMAKLKGEGGGIGGLVGFAEGRIKNRMGGGSQADMAAAHDELHGKGGGQTAGPNLQPTPLGKKINNLNKR